MADPIEAHYTPDGDDWTIAVTGRGRTLTGRAPGLIAARDRADQLVEELAPQESGHKTVVHMLNGDAVEFTTAYLTARLARTEEPPPTPTQTAAADEAPAPDEKAPPDEAADQEAPAESTEDEPPPVAKPTPFPRTESEAAHPKAQPATTEAETEQTAPSTN